jgi:hypothetical protein
LTGAYVWLCTFVGRNDQTAWRSETRFHKEWPVVPSRSRRRRTPREGSAALLCRHGNGGCNEPAQRDGGTRDFAIRFTCWRRRRGLPCTGGGAGGGRITQSWLGRRSGQRFHEHEGKSASPHFRNRRRDCETLLPCCIAWLPYSLLAKLTTRLTLAAPWIDPLTVGMNEEEDFPTCTAQQTG